VIASLVIVIPGTWFLFQNQATGPYQLIPQPISPAVIGLDGVRDKLFIDGNLNGEGVEFNHAVHKQSISKEYGLNDEETCLKCHHLNLPNDNASNCRLCHNDMEAAMPMFSMNNHQNRFKTAKDLEVFQAKNLNSRRQNFEACAECHQDNMKGLASYAAKGFDHNAPGYQHAMHGNCMTCHRQRGATKKADPVGEGNCLFCHKLPIAAGSMLTASQ
jgi:hypothetical protein